MTIQRSDSAPVAATVLYQGSTTVAPHAVESGDDLWLPLSALTGVTGWELKPEGVCRDESCVPLPEGRDAQFLRKGGAASWFNLSAFSRLVEQPFAHDETHHAWFFGPLGWEWKSRLTTQAAPDFTLSDLSGKRHSLSDHRGKKVLLALWASWCGCRFDIPVWEQLRQELGPKGFEVITVAEDTKGAEASEPFIRAANPTHPSLLDPTHLAAELFNTRNVPAVFWIDEEGRIVRANDPIYAVRRNRETGESTVNQAYLNGVRDWVEKGPQSIYLHNQDVVQSRTGQPDWADVQAMSHFRLGVHLHKSGDERAAVQQFKKAHALKPNNWNYKRQAWNLSDAQSNYGTTMQEARNDPAAQPFYLPLELPDAAKG